MHTIERAGAVHLIVAAAVLLLASTLLGWTWLEVRQDREALLERFAGDRRDQLAEGVLLVEEELDDLADDLLFAARLADSAVDPEAVVPALVTLLRGVPSYRVAAIYGPRGERVRLVQDPRWGQAPGEDVLGALDILGRSALESEELLVSTALRGSAETSWYRAFAVRLPGERGGAAGSVALVADTRPILERFRLLAAEPGANVLVLGPHGMITPASSPSLADRLAEPHPAGFPVLAGLVERMRAGEEGTMLLPRAEAVGLDLGDAPVVVAFAPVTVDGSRRTWSAATLVSTASLRDLEAALIRRLAVAGGAVTLLLVLFSGYVVFVARNDAATRESLRQATIVAHLKDRAERILDHVPALVAALDAEGRVTAANAALAAREGREVVGSTLAELFAASSAETRALLDELVTQSGREAPVVRHGEGLALFGGEGSYNVHVIPIRPATPEVDLLLVLEDLTEVEALRAQLLRVEKLSTVGILAAGIAHEVGTPLGIIRGRAEYALYKLGEDHPQGESLRIIVDQIDRVVRIIRGLLDFSSPHEVAVTPLALDELVAGAVELVRVEAERRGVSVGWEAHGVLPPVPADADQLRQVLVNLLVNALDACGPGDQVRVRLAHDPRHEAVRMAVSDTGCGVPTADIHRIFDPFYTTKKRGQGTGLGLSIVDQIVRDHGGGVTVHSEPGSGTTFEVLLPTLARAAERTCA